MTNEKTTDEQRIRAMALMLAEMKHDGNFMSVKEGKDGNFAIELTKDQVSYLKTLENHIAGILG